MEELSRIKVSEVSAKNKVMGAPSSELVEKHKQEFIKDINEWKLEPKGRKDVSCRVHDGTIGHEHYPDRSFFVGLQPILEEDGFLCRFCGVGSSWFEVSLPRVAAAKPEEKPLATRIYVMPVEEQDTSSDDDDYTVSSEALQTVKDELRGVERAIVLLIGKLVNDSDVQSAISIFEQIRKVEDACDVL
jgi:hypothetical protein